MHPRFHAQTHPEKPAAIMSETGEIPTYRELEARANQGAQLFRSLGLRNGGTVAFGLTSGKVAAAVSLLSAFRGACQN